MRLQECETDDAALGEEQANKIDEALDGVRSAFDQIEAKGSRSMIPHAFDTYRFRRSDAT